MFFTESVLLGVPKGYDRVLSDSNTMRFVRVNLGLFDRPQSDYNPKYRWIDIDLQVDIDGGQFMCCPRCETWDDHNWGENPDGFCECCEDIVMKSPEWDYVRRFKWDYDGEVNSLCDAAVTIQAAVRNRKLKRLIRMKD